MSRGSVESFVDMDLTPFVAPVDSRLFFMLWTSLLSFGFLFMGGFFVYGMSVSRAERSIFGEITLGLISSVCMGFGVLFLLLWGGLWV